ncbi:hypothetical protein D9M68_938640 [compost metagenome]
MGHFLERRARQLAAAVGGRGQLGAPPFRVVQVAAFETGVDGVDGFEIGAARAAAAPGAARQFAGEQAGVGKGAALESAALQIEA